MKKRDPESEEEEEEEDGVGVERHARGGGSSSAQLCVLAGGEKQLSSFQHRKATGRHCTTEIEGDGGRETDRGLNNLAELLVNLSFRS